MSASKNKVLSAIGIGPIQQVKEMLKRYDIPFNKNVIRKIDTEDHTTGFEVQVDMEKLAKDYEGSAHTPEFVKSGNIRIVIELQ